MTVQKANDFLDQMKKSGPTPELMAKIGKEFESSHMKEALSSRGIDLKSASGGSTVEWVGVGTSAAAGAC